MLLSPFLVDCFGFRGLPKMMITTLVYHYLLHSKFWYYILGLASIKKFFVNSCLVLPYHGLYIISGTVTLLFLVLSCCYFPANYAIIFIKKKNNKLPLLPLFFGIFKVFVQESPSNLCRDRSLLNSEKKKKKNCSSYTVKCT